jgi:hypothetical protein
LDDPHYPAAARAINRRVQAFAMREEQLMRLVGPRQSHYMAFRVFNEAIKSL